MTDGEKQLEEFKKRWIDKSVKIIGTDHPHSGSCGTVVSVDYTSVGYGLKIELLDGESCYVFKGEDLKII